MHKPRFSIRAFLMVVTSLAVILGLFFTWLRQPYEIIHEYPNGTISKREIERLEFDPFSFKMTYRPIKLWEFYDNGTPGIEKSFLPRYSNYWGKDGSSTDYENAAHQLYLDLQAQGGTRQTEFRPMIPEWFR